MGHNKKNRKGSSRTYTRRVGIPGAGDSADQTAPSNGLSETFTQKKIKEDFVQREKKIDRMLRGQTRESIEVIRGSVRPHREEDIEMHDNTVALPDSRTDEDVWSDEEDMEVDESFRSAMHDIVHLYRGKKKSGWRPRKMREEEAWQELMEPLTDAFLSWKHSSKTSPNVQSEGGMGRPPSDTTPVAYTWTVEVYDLFTLTKTITVDRDPTSISPAIDLLRHGYFAKTPRQATVAVSSRSLELLYRLRQRSPSFSVEAFAKVVCDHYMISYRSHLRSVFADTFEMYLRVTRNVEKRVYGHLGRVGSDWRALNACVACCYKLEGEPQLEFDRMVVLDGNSSLKRVRMVEGRVAGDTRVLDDSPFFLSQTFVDQYANEVRGRKTKNRAVKKRRSDDDSSDEESVLSDAGSEEGDPTDGFPTKTAPLPPSELAQPSSPSIVPSEPAQLSASSAAPPVRSPEDLLREKQLATCVKNWKAAAAEDKKKMWAIYEESGVFACACRHGFVLWFADMMRSGELAKYPLAMVSKVLGTHDNNVLFGYDIGCTAEVTVKKSSLGSQFIDKNAKFCVNAFHGYTHSHICQISYHPNVIRGMGIEDLETLERLFSSTNRLASVTRYMSPYRRRLFIETYLKQIEDDKHLNIGTFILNNYIQALNIIDEGMIALEASGPMYQDVTEENVKAWEKEEMEYFATLGEESAYNVHTVTYVELLQKLRELERKKEKSYARFVECTPSTNPNDYAKQASETRRLETERRHAAEQFDRTLMEVCKLEVLLEINPRWTEASPGYQEAVKYLRDRQYHRALNKLHRLVVQRIFELHKLNIAQTGYKMRMHLSKSLQVRCKTIKKALTAYNAAALALDPPAPTLDWSAVSHYGFLEQFTILLNTHNDVTEKRWADIAVRELIKVRRRIERAREEIVRLNVEANRVHTAIRDETQLLRRTLARLAPDNLLRSAIQEFADRRMSANGHVLHKLRQLYQLDGYTGAKEPGKRIGSTEDDDTSEDSPPAEAVVDEDDSDDEIGDEDEGDNMYKLVEYIGDLSVS